MKKIAFLALHLGYGGGEQAIINQANMFCDKYEVSMIVTYKLSETPAFDLNPKVKIIYLTDVVPNRKEFIDSLKSFNPFKIINEGLKSFRCLFLKYSKMRKYIINSTDDILISSRISFTRLLSKYGKNCIKIAEEHRHHNNDIKYIRSLTRACRNIDYLICVSKELTSDYSKIIKNTKCLYIPNSLSDLPNKLSNLNEKRLISVGRLSPEKGQLDLLDVFKLIYDEDSEFVLDIVGDGPDYKAVKEKISELGLTNNVIMHGFQNKKYIDKLLDRSALFLMCSYEESFGIVLIEAGSHGVPQIAFSSAQGAKEIIRNNKSGYIISNRNKKLMARKTIELYQDHSKICQFGKEARNIAESFSFDEVKNKWYEFLDKINN